MTLDDRLHKAIVTDELVEYTDGGVDYSKAKQAILSDLLEIMPKPSTRSGDTLGADTINEDYMRGNNDGYNQYYTELRDKVKEYCK